MLWLLVNQVEGLVVEMQRGFLEEKNKSFSFVEPKFNLKKLLP
jgi:hypothetical protein